MGSSSHSSRLLRIWLPAVTLLLGACTTRPPLPQIELPKPRSSAGSFPTAPPPDLTIRLSPDMSVPLDWLELESFFPPGARRVGPREDPAHRLAPDHRMRFPNAELYSSPDKEFTLFHDGMKRPKREILHWLMLHRRNASFPHSIFSTTAAFDATWAPDSKAFAVTHYLGRNSSEVFLCSTSLIKENVDVKPALREFFPSHFQEAALFVKAYRWTDEGRLIVRAIGRSWIEPFELFGLELVAQITPGDGELRTRFLRGFIRD
ncbi:MAG: hypothetical protein HZC55_01250 [Verrucomicrobia bacterium]|nr:hypothetical protein [Verrucomicrobiota bacterium]